jgi:hypothetical protein
MHLTSGGKTNKRKKRCQNKYKAFSLALDLSIFNSRGMHFRHKKTSPEAGSYEA